MNEGDNWSSFGFKMDVNLLSVSIKLKLLQQVEGELVVATTDRFLRTMVIYKQAK